MSGIELEKAKIDKHAIPWFDHNLERDNIVLMSNGRTEGLRETFTVIKLFYLQEREMLKAIMEVLKEDEENERKTWLIPRSQVLSMTTDADDEELGEN